MLRQQGPPPPPPYHPRVHSDEGHSTTQAPSKPVPILPARGDAAAVARFRALPHQGLKVKNTFIDDGLQRTPSVERLLLVQSCPGSRLPTPRRNEEDAAAPTREFEVVSSTASTADTAEASQIEDGVMNSVHGNTVFGMQNSPWNQPSTPEPQQASFHWDVNSAPFDPSGICQENHWLKQNTDLMQFESAADAFTMPQEMERPLTYQGANCNAQFTQNHAFLQHFCEHEEFQTTQASQDLRQNAAFTHTIAVPGEFGNFQQTGVSPGLVQLPLAHITDHPTAEAQGTSPVDSICFLRGQTRCAPVCAELLTRLSAPPQSAQPARVLQLERILDFDAKTNPKTADEEDSPPQLGCDDFPSIGSLGHYLRRCKPCAFASRAGCSSGAQCKFCHLCDPGENKMRRKEKRIRRVFPIDLMITGG